MLRKIINTIIDYLISKLLQRLDQTTTLKIKLYEYNKYGRTLFFLYNELIFYTKY